MIYGIIADIHANLEALEAVLASLSGVDQIVCAGDIVGYGPSPKECIALMRERNIACTAGNHDKAAIKELSTQWFNSNARLAIEWTEAQLNESDRAYLKELPLRLELEDLEIVHGSLRDPLEEYIYSREEADASIKLMQKPLCFVGHTHQPLYIGLKPSGAYDGRGISKNDQVFLKHYIKTIINPGSVGQPRDGDFRASFGIYDSEKKEFTLHRAEYDILAVQGKMKACGLPAHLIERLAIGR
jgi:predicted phosphodiesterase